MQPEPRHEPAPHVASQTGDVSRAVAWYGVGVLSVVQLFSFIDRQALSLLIGPIKAEFGMSDTQVSLVIGLGFAIAYAIAGLPIGRLVDQWSRPALLGLGLTLWSVCTAACGFAGSFTQLALLRSGVGIGEATLTPTVISFLGDYFPPSKRGISFGVFAVSVYVGSGLSLVAGSAILKAFEGVALVTVPIVGEVKPWQLVFLLIGLPGLLAVPLVLTLFEPRRQRGTAAAPAMRGLSMAEVLSHYRRHWPAFLTQHAASTMMAMLFYGVSAWVPEFLRRTYDMPISTAGFSFGLVTVAAGSLGVLSGGFFSDALLKRGYGRPCSRRLAPCRSQPRSRWRDRPGSAWCWSSAWCSSPPPSRPPARPGCRNWPCRACGASPQRSTCSSSTASGCRSGRRCSRC